MPSIFDTVTRKQAVIFDLFHTLTAIESSWGNGLPTTSEMLGVDREAFHEQLFLHSRRRLTGEERDPFRIIAGMARAIDPDIPDATIEAAVANRIRKFGAALLDIPQETRSVLSELKRSGKKLGLISNADAMECAAWARSPIAGLFDVAVLSCDVGCSKPDPEIYRLCLDRLGVEAGEALFVGDGGSDELPGAKAVGLTTVMITGVIRELWPDKIEQRRPHADFVIERLSELIADDGGGE